MGSFSFETARVMLASGLRQIHLQRCACTLHHGPAFDLLTTMSKFLCLDMPLVEVIRSATTNAARALRRPDLGTLQPGNAGDASILALEDGSFALCGFDRRASLRQKTPFTPRHCDRRPDLARSLKDAVMTPEEKLASLGLVLPEAGVPLANYVPYRWAGSLLISLEWAQARRRKLPHRPTWKGRLDW